MTYPHSLSLLPSGNGFLARYSGPHDGRRIDTAVKITLNHPSYDEAVAAYEQGRQLDLPVREKTAESD